MVAGDTALKLILYFSDLGSYFFEFEFLYFGIYCSAENDFLEFISDLVIFAVEEP